MSMSGEPRALSVDTFIRAARRVVALQRQLAAQEATIRKENDQRFKSIVQFHVHKHKGNGSPPFSEGVTVVVPQKSEYVHYYALHLQEEGQPTKTINFGINAKNGDAIKVSEMVKHAYDYLLNVYLKGDATNAKSGVMERGDLMKTMLESVQDGKDGKGYRITAAYNRAPEGVGHEYRKDLLHERRDDVEKCNEMVYQGSHRVIITIRGKGKKETLILEHDLGFQHKDSVYVENSETFVSKGDQEFKMQRVHYASCFKTKLGIEAAFERIIDLQMQAMEKDGIGHPSNAEDVTQQTTKIGSPQNVWCYVCRSRWGVESDPQNPVDVVTHYTLRRILKGHMQKESQTPSNPPDKSQENGVKGQAGLPSYASLSAQAMDAAVTMRAHAMVREGQWLARKKEKSPNGVGNFASLSALRRVGIPIDTKAREMFGQLQGHFEETSQIVDEMRIAKPVTEDVNNDNDSGVATTASRSDPLAGIGAICHAQMGQRFVQLSGDVFTLEAW